MPQTIQRKSCVSLSYVLPVVLSSSESDSLPFDSKSCIDSADVIEQRDVQFALDGFSPLFESTLYFL